MQNNTNTLRSGLSNYINTQKTTVVNKILKNTENQMDSTEIEKILATKTMGFDFLMDALKQENSSTKIHMGLALQFFITKFAVANAEFTLVKKEYECVSLPNAVKYYDLSYLINYLNDNLKLDLDIDLIKSEFMDYLKIKLNKTFSKLISERKNLEKHQEKYNELLLDIDYLNKGKVSMKITYLAFRYIISHKLFLLAVNRKYLIVNNSKKMLTFYNVAETVNELNTHLNHNKAA